MLFKRNLVLIKLLLIFLIVFVCSLSMIVSSVAADAAVVITDFKISTRDGSYTEGTPLVVGVNYDIEFIVDVAIGANENIKLQTYFEKQGANYWDLLNDYTGVQSNWQPGQKDLTFNAVPGTASFVLSGFVPETYTMTPIASGSVAMTLHRPGAITMLALSLQSGEVLEERSIEVIDESIVTYRALLNDRQKKVNDTSTVSQYKDLAQSIIGEAQIEANAGFTDTAIALLQTIPSSGWPGSGDSGSTSMILILVIVVVAVIAVVASILFLRTNSTVGFLKQRADDQSRRLEIVESRIQKVGEKSIAGEVAQVKDALRSMGR